MAQVITKAVELFGKKLTVPQQFDVSQGSKYGPKAVGAFVASRSALKELAVDTVTFLNAVAVALGAALYMGESKTDGQLYRAGVQQDYYKVLCAQLDSEHGFDAKFIANMRARTVGSPGQDTSTRNGVTSNVERVMKPATCIKRLKDAAETLKVHWSQGEPSDPKERGDMLNVCREVAEILAGFQSDTEEASRITKKLTEAVNRGGEAVAAQ